MHSRDIDNLNSSFSETTDYFIKLTQAQITELEYQQFFYRLIHLKKCVMHEFKQALVNHDITTQNYIINFSKKLAKLKNVVETSINHEELNCALADIMTAAETPLNIAERLLCAVTGIVGAILGAVFGTIGGAFSFGLLAAGAAGTLGILLAVIAPEVYFFLVATSAAVGILTGTVIGIAEGAKLAYQATQEHMKERHATKIENATIALFKVNKDSERYNSHLFFPNKKLGTTTEKNINLQSLTNSRFDRSHLPYNQ